MTEQLFNNNNRNFQSKYSLKKKELNLFPQMKYFAQANCNKSKEEIPIIHNTTNDKEKNGIICTSDFNVFYNKLQMKTTMKSNRTIDTTSFDNKRQFPNGMIMFNNKNNNNNFQVKSKENTTFISLPQHKRHDYSYKTQNNSLSKNNNQIILNKSLKGIKGKGKPLKLKVSLGNQGNYILSKQLKKQKYDSKVTNKQFRKNIYPLNTFINTQPSFGINNNNNTQCNEKPTHNNTKSIKPLHPLKTLKLNTLNINQRINTDCDHDYDYDYDDNDLLSKPQEKRTIQTEINRNEIDMIPIKLNKSDITSESEGHSGALEYDEVKDIIIYHDFFHLSKHNKSLFYDDDYNEYISHKKTSYLKFFNIEHRELNNPIDPIEQITIQGSPSKSIPLVKVTI